jgi:hypothetical protein
MPRKPRPDGAGTIKAGNGIRIISKKPAGDRNMRGKSFSESCGHRFFSLKQG